jgi:hypothetical protein
MNSRARAPLVPLLLAATALTGVAASLLGWAGPKLAPAGLYSKLLLPLLRMLCLLAAGLFAGQVLEWAGWTARLSRACSPLTKWARLKDESGAAFIASFVSGILANTLLMGFYTEKKMTRRELTLAYLLNSGLPLYLVHLPTAFFIVASLAGRAGLIYTALGFTAAFLRSVAVLLFSRLTTPPLAAAETVQSPKTTRDRPRMIEELRGKFGPRFLRLLIYTIPIYTIMVLLNEWGLFVWLREGAASRIGSTVLPLESAGVVIFALVAEFSSGMAAAGALVDAGTLTVKQTVTALMVGTIVATPVRAIRHQLPTHAGLFTLALGARLLLISQGFRIVSLIIVTAPYVLWF